MVAVEPVVAVEVVVALIVAVVEEAIVEVPVVVSCAMLELRQHLSIFSYRDYNQQTSPVALDF